MNTKVCVPVIIVLIGISCIAYGTWSWAGATAWCASYDDGWAIASGSVGWGGMIAGGWSTYAALGGFSDNDDGYVQGSCGGSSYLSRKSPVGAASSSISGLGTDDQDYSDADSDSF